MGMMDFFRGNEGGKHQTVPGPDNSPTQEEAKIVEGKRLRREALENLVVEIESDPNHEKRGELESLREELRSMQ